MDDISIDSGECVIPSQMFNCSLTEWVPRAKICNEVLDCTNGLDELMCGSCNFFNKTDCGYGQRYNGMFDQFKLNKFSKFYAYVIYLLL